jgi:hypothetical protein
MNTRDRQDPAMRYESDFGGEPKSAENLELSHAPRGQSCPQHYPQPSAYKEDPLGPAMSIEEVARMLGCSPWTVRQRYLPEGLPHLRLSPAGKIVFFRLQVIAWILNRQQRQKKGGTRS